MGILPIFIYVTLAVLFGIVVMVLTAFLGPKKPTPEKLAPYESGMQEIEAPKRRFPVKYLLTGMLFIVFDIEAVFLYPWVVVYRDFKMVAFVEMLIFIGLVLAGFFYIWKKGALDWSGEDPSIARRSARRSR